VRRGAGGRGGGGGSWCRVLDTKMCRRDDVVL